VNVTRETLALAVAAVVESSRGEGGSDGDMSSDDGSDEVPPRFGGDRRTL
jgi:hypothetical protein